MAANTRTGPPKRWLTRLLSVLLVATLGVVTGCGGGGDGDGNVQPSNPLPMLTSVSPTSALAGGAAFTLTANGSGFVSASTVHWNGASRPSTFVNSTQLTAAIPASDIASAGTAQVTIMSPSPGGGTSAAIAFTINAVAPVPAITSLAPSTVAAGKPRRAHRELLRRCLTGLIYEVRARSGSTAHGSRPAGEASKGPKPEAWDCELEAEARIRLAIRFDSMELDA